MKPVTEFYFRNRERSQRQPFCRGCKSRYNRDWYRRNRDEHIRNVLRNNERYRAAAREYVDSLKGKPCTDCGREFPPVAMDFDHVDASVKKRDISRMVRYGASIEDLKSEIDKCELVCSNCHRLRTAERRLTARRTDPRRVDRREGGIGGPEPLRLFAVE